MSPKGIDELAGETVIDVSAITVRVVDALTAPALAIIVAVPAPDPNANP